MSLDSFDTFYAPQTSVTIELGYGEGVFITPDDFCVKVTKNIFLKGRNYERGLLIRRSNVQ